MSDDDEGPMTKEGFEELFEEMQRDPECGPFMRELGVVVPEDLQNLRDEDLYSPAEMGQIELFKAEANAIKRPLERAQWLTAKLRDPAFPVMLQITACAMLAELDPIINGAS